MLTCWAALTTRPNDPSALKNIIVIHTFVQRQTTNSIQNNNCAKIKPVAWKAFAHSENTHWTSVTKKCFNVFANGVLSGVGPFGAPFDFTSNLNLVFGIENLYKDFELVFFKLGPTVMMRICKQLLVFVRT
jgi:hypothetical protein